MTLIALPAFSDNYIWMLHDGTRAVVVDPGDEVPVVEALDRLALQLDAILVTHHHPDHVGGVDALRPRLRGPVFGPAREKIPPPFVPVAEAQSVDVLGRRFTVIEVPGHTAGHVAYVEAGNADDPILFCGDTLFSAGCGRLFEGTPAQMLASLQRLAALPPRTRVCCTHEYTLSNLRFAAAVEPANARIESHRVHCEAERRDGRPTLPTTLELEKCINPFLRSTEPAVVESALRQGSPSGTAVDVFATLREWKNGFR